MPAVSLPMGNKRISLQEQRRSSGYNMLNIPDDDFDELQRQNSRVSMQSDLLNLDELDCIIRGSQTEMGDVTP